MIQSKDLIFRNFDCSLLGTQVGVNRYSHILGHPHQLSRNIRSSCPSLTLAQLSLWGRPQEPGVVSHSHIHPFPIHFCRNYNKSLPVNLWAHHSWSGCMESPWLGSILAMVNVPLPWGWLQRLVAYRRSHKGLLLSHWNTGYDTFLQLWWTKLWLDQREEGY